MHVGAVVGMIGLFMALMATADPLPLDSRIAGIVDGLDASDEQKSDVRTILTESSEARRMALEEVGGDFSALSFRERRALRSEMQDIDKATREKLSGVLSDQQLDYVRSEMDALRKEMRAAQSS